MWALVIELCERVVAASYGSVWRIRLRRAQQLAKPAIGFLNGGVAERATGFRVDYHADWAKPVFFTGGAPLHAFFS